MTKNKRAIIIGAGISGLSAGCYLQMNGYETEVFELHSISGGLCTSWKREGYVFDGCLHSIGGLSPMYRMNAYWNELVRLDPARFHFHDELGHVLSEDGQEAVTLYTDPDKLEQELISVAPDDADFIRELVQAAKHFATYDPMLSKPIELWTPLDYYLSQFKSAPHMRYLSKWRHSMKDMMKDCKSPVLKRALDLDFFARYPAYFFLFSLGQLHNRGAGYPLGGSLPLARSLEERYLGLGGTIHFDSKVARINVRNDRAVGITLENGEVHEDADVVISAADGHYTIFEMLQGKYVDSKIEKLYSTHPKWPSAVLVSLGIGRTFENAASQIELHLKTPFVVDGQSSLDSIPITIYNFDPSLSGEGKTCVRVILETDNYQYWADLRANDREQYKREKARIAADAIAVLERTLGNIAGLVEVVDVATPATFHRYTNNWMGRTQGWEWVPGLIPESIKKTLPGLKSFYMISQWVMPGGGVTSAAVLGRDVARIICKRDRRAFRTENVPATSTAP